MKTKSLIFLFVSCYFLMTCDDGFLETAIQPEIQEEEEIDYPLKYEYNGIENGLEFNPTEFYRYRTDSFELFTITEGDYVLADSVFYAEFYDETNEESLAEEFPVKIVELLNDTSVYLRFEYEGTVYVDSTFNYIKENDLLTFNLPDGTFSIKQTEDLNQLRFCREIFAFNSFDQFKNRRDFSGIRGRNCENDSVNKTLLGIVNDFVDSTSPILDGDTLLLNTSYYFMNLIE